jgi:hypothetical protein
MMRKFDERKNHQYVTVGLVYVQDKIQVNQDKIKKKEAATLQSYWSRKHFKHVFDRDKAA